MSDKETRERLDADRLHDEVVAGIRKALTVPQTKEEAQAARTGFLKQLDECVEQTKVLAEEYGVDYGGMRLVAEFRYDKDVGVYKIQCFRSEDEITIPHPVKRLSGCYTVDHADNLLAEARSCAVSARAISKEDPYSEQAGWDAVAEAYEKIDRWISCGGDLPKEWQREQKE